MATTYNVNLMRCLFIKPFWFCAFIAVVFTSLSTAHASDWIVIKVDHQKGSDQADIKSKKPLKTLKEAVRRANGIKKSVRIQLKAGVYREGGITISQREHPIVIECLKGEAIISGADVWSDWRKEGNLYVADWPYDWGELDLVKLGYFESHLKKIKPIAQRCEMVFVNDELLRQVLEKSSLEPGTFMVSNDEDKIYMMPPKRTNMKKAVIEVSVRPNLLNAYSVQGLKLRNLVFTKACSGNQHSGMGLYAVFVGGEHVGGPLNNVKPDRNYVRGLVVENCRFEWNNYGGFTVANTVGAKFTNSVFSNNGVIGVEATRLKDFVYEDCEFNANSWRMGLWGGFDGHHASGTKHSNIDNVVFRRCKFNDNHASGLWLDYGNENVVVEESEMVNNSHIGFYFEASYGPALLKKSTVMYNGMQEHSFDPADGGVLFAEAMDLTIEQCVIAYNANFQVGVRSRERKSTGYWSSRFFDGHCKNLTLKNSVVVGMKYTGENQPSWFADLHRHSMLVGPMVHSDEASFKRFLPTYKGSRNTFYNKGVNSIFGTGPQNGYVRIDFKAWQKLTGQDRTSVWRKVSPKLKK